MPQYAAFLGHQPHVSIAELAASIPGFALDKIVDQQVAMFSSSEELDPADLTQLGGCVLLAVRITQDAVGLEDIPQIIGKETAHVKKKVTFGLRCFGLAPREIKRAYHDSKEWLRKNEKPSRYIGNDHKPAATALLHDAGVISGKKGVELFLIVGEGGLWVGKTIAAQDINAYTKRDMEKPVRDTTVGLLPPKLAQIMLNLGAWAATSAELQATHVDEKTGAKPKRKKTVIYTVLDPFCGTGVIPLECLLRGWNVLASDSSVKAVNGCTKNIEWLRKEMKIFKKDVNDVVEKHDATKAFSFKQLPDMIVTETSLGPALTKFPNQRDLKKLISESEQLQAAFLTNVAQTVPGVPVVCIWPFWRAKGERYRLEKIWNALGKIGYTATLPDGITAEDPAHPSLLYQRKDQFVGREIVILKPTASRNGK